MKLLHRLLPLLITGLLACACGEAPLDEAAYAGLTAELLTTGFSGPEAERICRAHDTTLQQYANFTGALERDPDAQRRTADALKNLWGESWPEWSAALGEAFGLQGYTLETLLGEFGPQALSARRNARHPSAPAAANPPEMLEVLRGTEATVESRLAASAPAK